MAEIIDMTERVPADLRETLLSLLGELRVQATSPDLAAILDEDVRRVRSARTKADLMAATKDATDALLRLVSEGWAAAEAESAKAQAPADGTADTKH